MRPHC